MKLPKRLPYEILIAASLTLGSCQGPSLTDNQRDEVADICDAQIGDSDALVSVRDRLSAIEEKLGMDKGG